jgi:hypothetical protein
MKKLAVVEITTNPPHQMRPDGIQRWEDRELVVHATHGAETLCGDLMNHQAGSFPRQLDWLPVAPTWPLNCPGCIAKLKEIDGETDR